MAKRDAGIETLRGLALVLMVAGHVIGAHQKIGMHVADDSWWRYFYVTLAPYRMPLFTTISGFVYALRPITRDTVVDFATGKVRRLLVPFVTVATLAYLAAWTMHEGLPYAPPHMWKIYCMPFSVFWFLQAIMLIFVYVGVADLLQLMRSRAGWLLSLTTASVAYLVLPRTTVFSFHSSLYLLPCFVLGVGLNRFSSAFAGWSVRGVLLMLFAGSFALFQCRWLGWEPALLMERGLYLAAGTSGCALLFQVRRPFRPLAWLGKYAYGVYLVHIVFVSISHQFLHRTVGQVPSWLEFIVGLPISLVVPILIERSVQGLPWVPLLIFGQRTRVPLPVPAAARPPARGIVR